MISGSFTGQIQTSDRTHKFNMKKHIINAAIFLALQGPLAWLATAAAYSDNSGNYTSWTDGSNAGTGFGAWSFYSDNHGSGYAGLEKSFGQSDNMRASDNSEWKLYAVDYNTSASGGAEIEEATAYRALNSSLAVGQSFSLSFEYGLIANPGQVGFALRHGNVTGAYTNRNAGARLQVYFAGGGNNLTVEDASGANEIPGLGFTWFGYDTSLTLTGPNTYILTITRYNGIGTKDTPVVISGTLAGSGTIDSLAMFNWNASAASGVNNDAYFNRLAYGDCPTITMGSLPATLMQGTSCNVTNTPSGGTAPYNFVWSGSVPGMSTSAGGVLSGTPTTLGEYTLTATATDAHGCSGSKSYTIVVFKTGGDDSANYPYWTDGSNAGAGFGAWTFYANNHGSGWAGLEKAIDSDNMRAGDGSVWKIYAGDSNPAPVGDQAWEEATAYRTFNTPLSVAGDTLSLSFENGNIASPGQVGFALRNGDITGSGNRNAKARLQVYFAGGGNNLTVEDAAGAREISGLGFTYFGHDTALTLTGPNTYSLAVTRYNGVGTKDAPVVVTGTLSGSGPIDSLAMFNWNFSTGTSGANDDAYFNRLSYGSSTPLITNNVRFQVDMSVQIFAGNFYPSTDTVEVRGDFNGWTAATLTNNPAGPNPNLYSGVVSIVGAASSGESYKFTTDGLLGLIWESSSPKQSTSDTGPGDYNRFFQLPNSTSTVMPAVLFDDKQLNDYLPADTAVTFSVDMNGAVGADAHTFDPNLDTVWLNGEFVPWYAWYDPINPAFGPSQYQLSSVGGGIYSVTLTIPKGKPVAFAYKYGIAIGTLGDLGPRDDEAPVGQNHYRVIRSTATGSYTTPQDKFGTQYQEPFFNNAAKADGHLTASVPSAGRIPVTWLGRPGAHLQSAPTVLGPWTDHFNTDGTNWTSGASSANGLVSTTNWPALGSTFFRLVKP